MWTFLLISFCLLVGGLVGYFFGANIATHINTALGRPYFRTTVSRGTEQGTANIDAEFNSLFIYELERIYENKTQGGVQIIDKMAPDNEKVAIYLYDMVANIAENYLPPEGPSIEDIGADVPPLGFRPGGEEVKQVVDLGKQAAGGNVDYVE